MVTVIRDFFLTAGQTMSPGYGTDLAELGERLSRYHRTLNFIACRVLADPEMAAHAVENCRLRASQNPFHFETEGAFGSWILRLLIDEALSILHPDHATANVTRAGEP
jgi:DNA-directed RNA polymerase specialized sigma24 family protein